MVCRRCRRDAGLRVAGLYAGRVSGLAVGGRAIGSSTDVADEASVAAMSKAAIDEFGRIDILVNNAGIGIRKAPQDYTADEWRKVVDVNLTGSFLCAREVYPHMVEAGGGKIVLRIDAKQLLCREDLNDKQGCRPTA